MRVAVVGIAAALLLAGAAQGASFTNGSFEDGLSTDLFITLDSGSLQLDGWQVTGHSVDLIGDFWQASEGSNSLDLNGWGAGGVMQTFDTVAGTVYSVSFDISGNGYAGDPVKALRVSASDFWADYSFDTTGTTWEDMGWTSHRFEFEATGDSATLAFQSLNDSAFGVALDNVVVATMSELELQDLEDIQEEPSPSVPEPTGALLFGLGFAAVAARRRR